MAEDVMKLFEEYAAGFERGEGPDLRVYLERAGEASEELARLADVWVQLAEAHEPSEEAVAASRAWLAGEPPLLTQRTRRGLSRDAVVDAIVERFSLPSGKRDRVGRYYHEVETGLLRPSARIREALAAILGAPVRAWKPRPLAAEPAYFRTDSRRFAVPTTAIAPEEWDEVDALFRSE